jgi:adenylate kinase
LNILHRGGELPDEMLIELILKRVNMADCVKNGYVLDGFPKTRNQAILLAKAGILPYSVLTT